MVVHASLNPAVSSGNSSQNMNSCGIRLVTVTGILAVHVITLPCVLGMGTTQGLFSIPILQLRSECDIYLLLFIIHRICMSPKIVVSSSICRCSCNATTVLAHTELIKRYMSIQTHAKADTFQNRTCMVGFNSKCK